MRRLGLLALGWIAVALGGLGVFVPGLPTTGFFVLAAACFARSSPRFEQWVLGLPKVGPLVRDHRAGLGMPRRAKVVAIGFNFLTIRRFWAADHRWRWAYTAIALTVIALLLILMVEDIFDLVT